MVEWMKTPALSGIGTAGEEAVFAPFEDRYSPVAVWPTGRPFPAKIENGEARFDFATRGPWSALVKLRGLAVEKTDKGGVYVWGMRSLQKPRESGYVHEGTVSVGGKTRRAFTSSQLFRVEGKLVDVGVLYVCRSCSTGEGG